MFDIFGGITGQSSNLGTVVPDGRERAAREELRAAEAAYGAAENRLIKARRAYEAASREYQNFYYPRQGLPDQQ
jgi:hypothetical protein